MSQQKNGRHANRSRTPAAVLVQLRWKILVDPICPVLELEGRALGLARVGIEDQNAIFPAALEIKHIHD